MGKLQIAANSVTFALAHTVGAQASEITVWAQRAIVTVLAEVGSKFEQQTGHKLKVTYDLTPRFLQRIGWG